SAAPDPRLGQGRGGDQDALRRLRDAARGGGGGQGNDGWKIVNEPGTIRSLQMSVMETHDDELLKRHEQAEANWTTYSYKRPAGINSGKGFVNLGRNDIVRGAVQVVKKHGGENNLHYHTNTASFWMVLKGRVRFYGPGDAVLGEFGPHEGMITPRYSR